MTRILHIGDVRSPFVSFVLEVAESRRAISDVIAYYEAEKPHGAARFTVIGAPGRSLFRRVKVLLRAVGVGVGSFLQRYDLMLVNYVSPAALPAMALRRLRGTRVIAVVWGSDFNAPSRVSRGAFSLSLRLAQRVLFMSPKTRSECVRAGLVSFDRSAVCRFALPALDCIKKLSPHTTRTEAKLAFGFPVDRPIVMVGTNSRKGQQHEGVINSILSSDLPKGSAYYVFLMGYGDESYADAIKPAIALLGHENSKILSGFYEGCDLAKLRLAADVLINVQTHDQFSGAMVEHLYAGASVITGAWLPYDELRVPGVALVDVASVKEVGAALKELLRSRPTGQRNLRKTRLMLEQMCGYEHASRRWAYELFNDYS